MNIKPVLIIRYRVVNYWSSTINIFTKKMRFRETPKTINPMNHSKTYYLILLYYW